MNNLVKIESTELDKVVTNSGLAIQEGEEIKQSYIPFIVQLAEIQAQSSKINFESPSQLDEEIAGKLRKQTVKVRTAAMDLKDERKKVFLLKGNLEQAAYNLISASCKLTEETFLQVEKAREIAEKKFKEERKVKRIKTLMSFDYDLTFTDLLNMPDESFDKLILQLENERDLKIQIAAKIEKERLEKLEAEKIENERIRIENEKLKKEAEEKECLAKIEREKIEKEREIERQKQAEILAKQHKEAEEKAKIEAEKQAKIQAELKAKAEKERIEKERIEKELQAQKANEYRFKLQAEKEQKEKEIAIKKAELAPDKEKLNTLIDALNIPTRILQSELAVKIDTDIRQKFNAFKKWAKTQIETL